MGSDLYPNPSCRQLHRSLQSVKNFEESRIEDHWGAGDRTTQHIRPMGRGLELCDGPPRQVQGHDCGDFELRPESSLGLASRMGFDFVAGLPTLEHFGVLGESKAEDYRLMAAYLV